MKQLDFEESLKRLEEIVSKLESGNIALEESLTLFEEGVKLSRHCKKKLDEAEKKVQILMKTDEGEKKAVPFKTGENAQISFEDSM